MSTTDTENEVIPEAEQSGNLPAVQEEMPVEEARDAEGPDQIVFGASRADMAYNKMESEAGYRQMPEGYPPEPRGNAPLNGTYVTGHIDVGAFVRAQAEFIARQTVFLERGGGLTPEQEFEMLDNYSLAQSAFIAAQQGVLRQLGIL